MSNELRFDDRVVIVTGAGNGLGRSHALAFAARGAKVVVNDLGGDPHGAGKGNAAADKVVAEIKEAGGEAVANYDSVVDGDKIVQATLDHFKKIDVVINNAGILRDVSFHKMTDEDWDLVYQVHVKGSYKVTHAAWPHLRDQQFGRVLFTASAAGLYGNFGQANYSMAKLGILGLAKTLAVEGRKRNIHVNTIAPVAGSRLTETIMPPEIVEQLKPQFVSPLVVKLCHENSDVTGGIYEVGAGWISTLRWERTRGHSFKLSRDFTAEDIERKWDAIHNYSDATNPTEVNSALEPIMANLKSVDSKGGNEFIDVDEALGYELPPIENSYDEKALSLYALGIGAATNPLDESELRFVYENHTGGFQAFPTYGVIPALNAIMQSPQVPGMNYGFDRILHGEQYLELKRPLPRRANLTHKSKISEIWDKGKNAIVVTETRTFDESGEELCVNKLTTVVRGAGGWGGDRGPSAEPNEAPDRKPDAVVEQQINANQALLYRLTGDINPLHADPQMAKAVGFDKPILHGLCTFGHAARHVLQEYADGDVGRFKSIQVRFADVVFPGETLITEMWKEDDRILFRCKIKERDKEVIKHAAVELYEQAPAAKAATKPKTQKKADVAPPAAEPAAAGSAMIFQAIQAYVGAHPELVGQIDTVFQFKFTDPDSSWVIDLKTGDGEVREGDADNPDVTLTLTDADFVAMATGKENAQQMYFAGRLKLAGNMMAAQKLQFLQKIKPEEVAAAAPAPAGDAKPAAAASSKPENAAQVFGAIQDYVSRHPELVSNVGAVFQFNFSEPDSQWVIDLKSGLGEVREGTADNADATLNLTDADFLALSLGKENAQQLYFAGRLKLQGNIMMAQKLEFLQDMRKEAEGGGGAPTEPKSNGAADPAAADAPGDGQAADVFPKIAAKLSGGVYQFVITEPDSEWFVDASKKKPEAEEGRTEKADVTLTLTDADLVLLVGGDTTPRELFQKGRLEVSGDMNLAHKLEALGG